MKKFDCLAYIGMAISLVEKHKVLETIILSFDEAIKWVDTVSNYNWLKLNCSPFDFPENGTIFYVQS